MKRHLLLSSILVALVTIAFAQKEVPSPTVASINKTLHGTHGHGDEHILPKDAEIKRITIQNSQATIYFNLPQMFLRFFDEDVMDEMTEHLVPALATLNVDDYFFKAKNKQGKYVSLEDFLPTRMIPQGYDMVHKNPTDLDPNPDGDIKRYSAIPPMPKQPKGRLAGKTVWLSAGHGWRYKRDSWRTQRINTFGMVEDFASIEAVNYYLLKYLENSGANVWTVRERDMNTNEVIVDDESTGFATTGSWAKSTARGYNKNYQYIYTRPQETGRAIFTPNIPESGYYWVSVYYRTGGNRAKDTRYRVQHAGGETVVSINQEVHGLTWVYLGQFYFEKGRKGKVILTNQSSDIGQAIIADAVRFGGGMGSVKEQGGISRKPRFEEAAMYYARYQGFMSRDGDVTIRPEYAEWELSKGTWQERQNAVYVSWHTNAGGGKGTGTESFIYNRGATKGSASLRNYIHRELVKDIKNGWDSNWRDRGLKSANFGELRRLKTMPGTLIEIGFHDNENDAKALLTPQFRQLAAKAVYKGIVRYFAAKDGRQPIFLPDTPTHLNAKNIGSGQIQLTWNTPTLTSTSGHAATGYKVYMSTHGKGFPEGIEVTNNTYTFRNLKPGTTYYFKVSATNQGGESFTTPVVAARTPKTGQVKPQFLIVDGFDRIDRFGAIQQYDGARLGITKRLFIDRMNRYDYAVEHAKGLEYANMSFDGATNEAVISKAVNLRNYKAINWFLGEESRADATLDATERQLITQYLNSGGRLMISGSEHAYDMARQRGTDPTFFSRYLKSKYVDDDANTYRFRGVNGGLLTNLRGNFDDSKNGYYDIDFPDRLAPVGGAKVVINYEGGSNDGAAIAYDGQDFKVVNFGFPIETVVNETVRNELIARSARFLVGKDDFEVLEDFDGTRKGHKKNDMRDKIVPKPDVKVKIQPPTTTVKLPNTKRTKMVDVSHLPNPANITSPFKTGFTVNLVNVRNGKVTLTIRNKAGKKVGVFKWRHADGRSKRLTVTLPPGVYDYELKGRRTKLKGKMVRVR